MESLVETGEEMGKVIVLNNEQYDSLTHILLIHTEIQMHTEVVQSTIDVPDCMDRSDELVMA